MPALPLQLNQVVEDHTAKVLADALVGHVCYESSDLFTGIGRGLPRTPCAANWRCQDEG